MCQCFDLFGDALDTFVETPPIAAEVLNDPDHAGRQYIDPLSQNLRELLTKEAKPLAHWKREVVCNETVERYVERLRNFRSEEVKRLDLEEPIFCHPNGRPTHRKLQEGI